MQQNETKTKETIRHPANRNELSDPIRSGQIQILSTPQ